jgi:DNA-directed RNA polymerase subunit beta
MAGKAIPQALSLVEREAPLVQTLDEVGVPFVKRLGNLFATKSRRGGEVVKVTPTEVHVRTPEGEIEKVKAVKNLPFNIKGFQDDEAPLVKPGDKVFAKTTPVFDNNYTKDGTLALGKNLRVAYMPWKGYNHEDGIVISEKAAGSLSSHHAYKVNYDVSPDTVAKKAMLKRYFPGKFTPEQLNKLDDSGYAIPGSTLEHGDPVYAVLEKREPTPEDRILGRLHKMLVNPYRLVTEPWTHEENCNVVDAHTDGKAIRILLRSVKSLEIGDKLTGLHGNKGVVSLILPDNKMPYNKETGQPVDLVLNPASVTSRINLGQLMETAASKIAEKTGTPYLVKNYEHGDNLRRIQKELHEHGISDTDTLIDPSTGKEFGDILSGKQYILKLYKTTDQNYSARNVGGYDNIFQPTKGGEEGSKSVGYMELLGLLGSNARHNLKEIATTKSEQNDDYWAKFIKGEPLPKPNMTFATKKFFDYLKGSGVNVKMERDNIMAAPLTDHDVLAMSNGKLTNAKKLDSKDLTPEDGGLFDQAITGGLKGDRWSHYPLAEPIVNPIMEHSVKAILGLNGAEFDGVMSGKYGVKRISPGVFHMHDTDSGKFIREIKV